VHENGLKLSKKLGIFSKTVGISQKKGLHFYAGSWCSVILRWVVCPMRQLTCHW